MPVHTDDAIGIYYEHPEWFRPLFAELDRRGLPYQRIRADESGFDPAASEIPYGLVFNRMSPSAHLRGHGSALFYTGAYLRHLERLGVRVLNGSGAWQTEVSKARQLALFETLGVAYPRARVIHRSGQAPWAARGLRFPVVVKPNVGGSGAGIRRFDDPEALERAAREEGLELGVDSTALVQELAPARDGRIVRVEVVDDRVLYAIRVRTTGEDFNLCPADLCDATDSDLCPADERVADRAERYEPPPAIRETVRRIIAAAGMELGGVEYLVDDRDGRVLFYDVNALSNFVADAPRVLGFDPFRSLVDWLEREWRATTERVAGPIASGRAAALGD